MLPCLCQYVIRAILIAVALFAESERLNADTAVGKQLQEIRDTWMTIARSTTSCSYESSMQLSRGEGTEPQKIATERNRKVLVTTVGHLSEIRTYLTDAGNRTFDGHNLFVANDHYSCSLLDRANDNRFIIIELPKMLERKWSEETNGEEKMRCCLPWLFPDDTYNIADLIDPRLSEIVKIEDLGGGLLRIPFVPRSGLSEIDKKKFCGVTSGVLILNRERHFRLESAEIQFDPKYFQTSTYRLKYGDTPASDYLLKRIESDTKFVRNGDKVAMTAKNVLEYDCRHNVDFDPKQFYISHYGLPEVLGISPPKKPIPIYVWLLSASVALGIISLLLRWLLKYRLSGTTPHEA